MALCFFLLVSCCGFHLHACHCDPPPRAEIGGCRQCCELAAKGDTRNSTCRLCPVWKAVREISWNVRDPDLRNVCESWSLLELNALTDANPLWWWRNRSVSRAHPKITEDFICSLRPQWESGMWKSTKFAANCKSGHYRGLYSVKAWNRKELKLTDHQWKSVHQRRVCGGGRPLLLPPWIPRGFCCKCFLCCEPSRWAKIPTLNIASMHRVVLGVNFAACLTQTFQRVQ